MIKNKINNRIYVGQSKDIYSRWYKHKKFLTKQTHHNRELQKDWLDYGENNFSFSILEQCDETKLNERESYSKMQGVGYNKDLMVFNEITCKVNLETVEDEYIIGASNISNIKISPGTNSSALTSLIMPSLLTKQVGEDILFNASNDFSAFAS